MFVADLYRVRHEVEHEVLEVPEQPWFLRFLRLTTDLLPRLRVFEGSSKVPQRPFVAKRT